MARSDFIGSPVRIVPFGATGYVGGNAAVPLAT